MAKHKVIVNKVLFDAIRSGSMRAIIRSCDVNYKLNDVIYFHELDKSGKRCTGRVIHRYIIHVASGVDFGVPSDMMVVSLYCY